MSEKLFSDGEWMEQEEASKESRPHEWEEEKLWIWKQMADDWDLFSSVRFKLIPIESRRMYTSLLISSSKQMFWKHRD